MNTAVLIANALFCQLLKYIFEYFDPILYIFTVLQFILQQNIVNERKEKSL